MYGNDAGAFLERDQRLTERSVVLRVSKLGRILAEAEVQVVAHGGVIIDFIFFVVTREQINFLKLAQQFSNYG
jgi:hypothetical protein